MYLFRLLQFLIIVTLSQSAGANPNLQLELPASNPQLNMDDMSITKIEESNTPEKKILYYPYLQSMTPRMGLLLNPKDLLNINFLIGALYMFPSQSSPHIEVGFEITTLGHGYTHVTRRHIINERRYFRAFYKYGVALLLDPEKNITNVVELQNYQFRGGIGIEDVLKIPMSVRLEIEVLYGTAGLLTLASLGYSWGL